MANNVAGNQANQSGKVLQGVTYVNQVDATNQLNQSAGANVTSDAQYGGANKENTAEHQSNLYHTKKVTRQVQAQHANAYVLDEKHERSKLHQAHPAVLKWLEKQGIAMNPTPFHKSGWAKGTVTWKDFLKNYAEKGWKEWQKRCVDPRFNGAFQTRIFMPFNTIYSHRHVPPATDLVGRLVENIREYAEKVAVESGSALPSTIGTNDELEETFAKGYVNSILELASLTRKGDDYMLDVMDDLFLPYFKVISWVNDVDGRPCPVTGYLMLFEEWHAAADAYKDQYMRYDQQEMDRMTYDDLDIVYR